MIKTELNDYKTTKVSIEYDGEPSTIEVRSMSTREFRNAQAKYSAMIKHAKDNDISMVDEVDHEELGVKFKQSVMSDYAKKAMAVLLSSLVVDWPFESDLVQDIFENPELGDAIDSEAAKLNDEFLGIKKI